MDNVLHKRVGHTSESATLPREQLHQLLTIMDQPRKRQLGYSERKISLAISAIQKNQLQSMRCAATVYNVLRTTLQDRRASKTSWRNCEPNSKKLTKPKESVIIQHILDLDLRGFAPKLSAVWDMANQLLGARAAGQVGINWPDNFVRRTPEFKT